MNRIQISTEDRYDLRRKLASNKNARHAFLALTAGLDGHLVRLSIFVLAISIAVVCAGSAAAETMQSLDEQVQEVKADVLAIAAELSNLEEKLLYPSNTQIAIFVSIEEGHEVALDYAHISIDGELVAEHIYSFKELEALQKGGVQRIYTGNIITGDHRIEVSLGGKKDSGKDFIVVENFVFSKAVDPKLVGIRLAGRSVGNATISIEEW